MNRPVFLLFAALAVSCSREKPGTATPAITAVSATPITIVSVSNRADLLSGGDALVEIHLPPGLESQAPEVSLNDTDVSNAFRSVDGGAWLGYLGNLVEGDNQLVARAGGQAAQLILTNHPQGGPVFSGPQIQPWICAEPKAREGDADNPAITASGLATGPQDSQCNAPAEVSHYYRTTDYCGRDPDNPRRVIPCFKRLEAGASPADMAMVTAVSGQEIPFIVRVERGTMNRGIYDIAVLDQPGTEWSPFVAEPTWNGKLVHTFGGSTGSPRRQLAPNSSALNELALARGYMVSVSNLTDQALNYNKVVAAETVMMLKEHITENYGVITHTIGSGCSGGSIMQLVIAGAYPGLLDGIQPMCTYPDSDSTRMEVTDCVLLENYFGSAEFARVTDGLSDAQRAQRRAAIAGHPDGGGCGAWSRSIPGSANEPGNFQRTADAPLNNNCRLPLNWVVDPQTNPDGVRCSVSDYQINILGLTPGENYARRYNDNFGIQYGLQALESGAIGVEEFVTLNERIGGSDIDRGLVPERMVTDAETLDIVYRSGMVTDPRQWAKTPIIDLRGNDNSGIHMNWRAFAVRDRLDRVLGHHDNQVIWRYGPGLLPPEESGLAALSLDTMDAWITAINADTSDAPREVKVVRNKPEVAFDFCYIGDDYATKVTDQAVCDADPVLAYYSSPRQVAGGPLAEDILKCSLQPLDRAGYPVSFSDAQWQRMQAAFPQGVCDWNQPGVGMRPAIPWLDYSARAGGEPLPAPPVSLAL